MLQFTFFSEFIERVIIVEKFIIKLCPIFFSSTLHQFKIYQIFLSAWLLCDENWSNFVSPTEKFNDLYWHNVLTQVKQITL